LYQTDAEADEPATGAPPFIFWLSPLQLRFKIVRCRTRTQQGWHHGDNSFGLIVLVLENSVELFSINWLFIICFGLQSMLC
jgi:hypothetical protein